METKAQNAIYTVNKRIATLKACFIQITEAQIKIEDKEFALLVVRKTKILVLQSYLKGTEKVKPDYKKYLLIVRTLDDVEQKQFEFLEHLTKLSMKQGKPTFEPVKIEKFEITELTGGAEEGWAVYT